MFWFYAPDSPLSNLKVRNLSAFAREKKLGVQGYKTLFRDTATYRTIKESVISLTSLEAVNIAHSENNQKW
jgi:hypothetical protein